MALTDLSQFTPRVLSQSVQILGDARQNYLLNNLFTRHNTHPTDLIDFGSMQIQAHLLAYTKAGAEAQPVSKASGDIKAVKAPMIRVKKALDQEFFRVLNPALASYMGTYTDPNAQAAEKVAIEQADLRRRLDRMIEIQCVQALTSGTITLLLGDGSTLGTISMGFTGTAGAATIDPSVNIQKTLTGTDLWSNNDANPFITLETLAAQVRDYSDYSGQLVALIGLDAWLAILNNDKWFKMLNNNSTFVLGQGQPAATALYKGTFNGIDFFQYSQGYVNSAGARVQAFPSDSIVIMPASPDNFSIEFGAPFDYPDPAVRIPQFIQTEYFSKFATHQDPPESDLIVESRPLALIKNPKAIRIQKVI
jgi:hypothetical protein